MAAYRILSSQLRTRYAAAAAVATLATNAYLLKRSTAHCEAPYDHSALQNPRKHSLGLPHRKYASAPHTASAKRGDAGLIPDLDKESVDSYHPAFEDDDTSAWSQFSRNVDSMMDSLNSIEWTLISSKIADFILPAWARQVPDLLFKLQDELSLAPGSLADEIWQEAADASINPEILWDARVRIGNDLCKDEEVFLRKRKEYTRKALAHYLGLKEKDVHPDDVPTIAMCGSGGGLRALVAGTSSYLSAKEAGLFDCATYTAGVSGSCWLQTLYYSSLTGQNHKNLIKHLKNRIGIHIAFPPAPLKAITTAPTNKFLLSGFVEKLKGDPEASFGLVDVYGLLLGSRLLVPKGELGVCDRDLKLSNQRTYTDTGAHPLPIYTAVRHEIPVVEEDKKDVEEGKASSEDVKERARREAWFQWFEFTPYEFFCEELGAGIPTWSLGRKFKDGHNLVMDNGLALPELRVPLLLGIFGSAFCATLAHYYKEVRPALAGVAGFASIDSLLSGMNEDLIKLHPIEPAMIPNYVVGLQDKLSPTCPESLFKTDHIQLMDAGMSNNLPIYPLLRPGRDVDIIISFDASADIKMENWLSVVEGYARQRDIKGWPIGAGWPPAKASPAENVKALEEAQASSAQDASKKVSEIQHEEPQKENHAQVSISSDGNVDLEESDLGYVNVWVGSAAERSSDTEPPPSKRLEPTKEEDRFHLMKTDAGITVIYFPFLPNSKVPGVDPDVSDFMSTWNFVYTPDEIDSVVALARANFQEGAQQTKDTVRAVYERKKKMRLEREEHSRIKLWKRKMLEHGDTFV